jgi:succinyl-CoA synthetase alpha subunit
VFNTFGDAVDEQGANTAMVFVPPRFAADSILEAADAGIKLIICITEGIPAHDELRVYTHLKRAGDVRLVGPNCPGILSPGKANVGIIPASFFKEGNVGVVSRSGTLTTRSATSWPRAASATRRSSASAATRSRAPRSSTRSRSSRPTRRPSSSS